MNFVKCLNYDVTGVTLLLQMHVLQMRMNVMTQRV